MKKREFSPGVLVVEEKHGTAYFHIPNEVALHAAALMILTGRYKAGYWYGEPEMPRTPAYTDEAEIGTLRGAPKLKAQKDLQNYKQELADYDAATEQYRDIQRAIETLDGALAWGLLQLRSDYAYEQVTLELYATKYGG